MNESACLFFSYFIKLLKSFNPALHTNYDPSFASSPQKYNKPLHYNYSFPYCLCLNKEKLEILEA